MIQRIIEKADVKHPVDADKILKEIKNYDIVSFDIFDTLLKRNVKEPTDVFSYMEKKYQINGFREKRIEAEKAARKKKNGLEISLEDIYAEFGADYSDEEMETESGLLIANAEVYPIFRKCIESKTVIIVSDMYLPENFIKEILKREQIVGYKKLYLSSVIGKTKSSGNLFEYVRNDVGLNKKIVHVIDCNTGIVGCLVIALVHLISFRKNNLIEIMSKPTTIITFFVLSTFLLVGTDLLLNNQYINNIFGKFSHTSKLLSGRLDMYAITLNGIKAALWMGHGINCTLVQDVLSWGNPQNGLLKMLLDFGIIGTASFLLLIYDSTKNNRNNNKQIEYSMLAFVYGMIICSMVEINLSGLFYLGLVLLKMSKRDVQKNF